MCVQTRALAVVSLHGFIEAGGMSSLNVAHPSKPPRVEGIAVKSSSNGELFKITRATAGDLVSTLWHDIFGPLEQILARLDTK
jgi:hypothetical protein